MKYIRIQKPRRITALAIVVGLLAIALPMASADASVPSGCATSNAAVAPGSSPGSETGNETVDDDSEFAAALRFLAESTDLLDQSDDVVPVIDDGKLQSTCEVAFELEGTQTEINAKGVSGLKISSTARWLVQALEGNRGHRMMVVLENSTAPATYEVDLELASGLSVVSLDDGGAVFVDETDHVVGSILAPWALDANANPVPITQTVTGTSITITVQANADTAWPVIADPTYHNLNCTASMVTTTATASRYLNGARCPRYADIIARGYYPKWIHHFERWRVGKPNGECSHISERRENIFGVIYDFTQACQGHDYCYDLGHSDRLNYQNVHKGDCDQIFRNDMYYDCSKRHWSNRSSCWFYANQAHAVVVACPNWLCF